MKTGLFSPTFWRCTGAWLALLACALWLATPARADPPGRIGRIAWLSGSGAVDLFNRTAGAWYSAPLNQPLTSGDVLSTRAGSRAEIQIGSITVRLDSGSMLDLVRIDDEQVRLDLNDGRAIVKLPSADAIRDFEMGIRNARFRARDTGIYRFDAESGSSSATAYSGALHASVGDSELVIDAGHGARFWHTGEDTRQTRYRLSIAVSDEFTAWSVSRDQRATANTYARYVSPEMTGAEDLDTYGIWSEHAEYGAIWIPRSVAADWAPYRSGHWAWVAPWGWNWVGDEPWGFAPFHYGRWVRYRGAWAWVPGRRTARPVYAPAMVAWIGTPGGVSVSIGTRPAAGWFPLAPREVYVPAYRSSPKHVSEINVTHVDHIGKVTNVVNGPQAVVRDARHVHRELPQAVTGAPADVGAPRRPVAPAAPSPKDHGSPRERSPQVVTPTSAAHAEARGRHEHPGQTFDRRERAKPAPRVGSAPIPGNVGGISAPAAPLPHAPVVALQRSERPTSATVRPAPSSRPEPLETAIPERRSRRDEPPAHQAPREVRGESGPQQVRQVSSARLETPPPRLRESRPEPPSDLRAAEPRGEASARRHEGPQHPRPEPQRDHRDAAGQR